MVKKCITCGGDETTGCIFKNGFNRCNGCLKEYQLHWREKNKEKRATDAKKYRDNDKEYLRLKRKRYYNINKKRIIKNSKKYYTINKDKVREYKKNFYNKNTVVMGVNNAGNIFYANRNITSAPNN